MDGNQINSATYRGGRRMRRALGSGVVIAMSFCVGAASAQAIPTKPAEPPRATESLPMTKFARERGFVRCAGALELAERNLLGASEYAFRAYPLTAPTVPRATAPKESTMFTAIVDARKRNPNDAAPRATFNITVLVSQQVLNACTTIYEQTIYHAATCDAVVAQMAPNGKQSSSPSYGSVLVDVSDNLSLTLIPVGAAQCITVVKEVAMDVPNPASLGARR